MRQNETNGIDYYFVTNEEFLDGIDKEEFIKVVESRRSVRVFKKDSIKLLISVFN